MRILIAFILILLASPCYAQVVGQGLVIQGAMVGEGTSGDACLGGTTHYAGNTTDYGDTNYGTFTGDMLGCVLYTANCGGQPFTLAHFHKHDTGADNVKMCVYTAQHSTEHSPDSGDTKIGCTDGESTSGLNWVTLTGNIGGTVTNGGSYWVCLVAATTTEVIRTAAGTRTFYYQVLVNGYTSPPATLTGTWTGVASRDFSMYVEID